MMMGKAISLTPFLAASNRVIPSFSMSRYTFSTTTIPLSTSIPKPITKANRTMVFIVYPNDWRIKKEINIDIGMANPTNKALRNPRKKVRTVTTKRTPNKMLLIRSVTWLMVMAEVSFEMVTSISCGMMVERALSTISRMASAAWIRFLPPRFLTSNITTDCPKSRAWVVASISLN